MTKRMLIDATHAEETRVVVLDGNRLEDFDVETAARRQLKGNIYLAKVVRVEPSLQAAFVEYGGNRHGFLAFGEIHPDYYQIPVADRQKLLAWQAEQARAEEAAEEAEQAAEPLPAEIAETVTPAEDEAGADTPAFASSAPEVSEAAPIAEEAAEEKEAAPPEQIGGESEAVDEGRERRVPPQFLRNYKIQEVIHRRQILLIQVVKEERGGKGAALTTYVSLAGRFCVLMPNSLRGGGISRKITSAADRRRLKEVMVELDIPEGMGLIVRTAGANRPKPEIKRDCEYLLRLWDEIRQTTLRAVAPALIYEEASLIKRAIRDVYSRDIDEIVVDGEAGYRAAREFMAMLMPAHVRKVIAWHEAAGAGAPPLFARHQVEAQLDAMLSPTAQLKSGGYLVINQAEALVAIDVNSGRSTRERGIEETALRTNLEAADEVARQLRLRDLAGLIVIDFIDMESRKHNLMVERRIKEALAADRARIQVGQISAFGLLEMSRQRLRPSLAETSLIPCPHCAGLGHVRSTESAAIHVLRAIEEEAAKRRAAEITVHVAPAVAMYVLNAKREQLSEIEQRYSIRLLVEIDASLFGTQLRLERTRALAEETPVRDSVARMEPQNAREPAPVAEASAPDADDADEESADEEAATVGEAAKSAGESVKEGERKPRRRRRRRRGGRREEGESTPGTQPGAEDDSPAPPASLSPVHAVDTAPEMAPSEVDGIPAPPAVETAPEESPPEELNLPAKPIRRRAAIRRPRRAAAAPNDAPAPAAESLEPPAPPEPPPAVTRPTPADPFGGGLFDIFAAVEDAPAAGPPLDPSVAPQPDVSGPLVQPTLIDANAPLPDKKRGWWRR
nr:ribonuclease E/G [uncultured Alphaproteobacteria bacterium]